MIAAPRYHGSSHEFQRIRSATPGRALTVSYLLITYVNVCIRDIFETAVRSPPTRSRLRRIRAAAVSASTHAMVHSHWLPAPARILLAEDDRTTARLIEVALHRTGVPHELSIVYDGEEAVRALELPGNAPSLFLLDIQMPGKNGFQVLEHIKKSDRLRRIPVVMFTSSSQPSDVNRAYDLHANAYVLKHPNLPELTRAMESILGFWLKTAMTPFAPF